MTRYREGMPGLTLGEQVALAHAHLTLDRQTRQPDRDLSLLRALLGHRGGDIPCCARQHPPVGPVCLLPARHVAEGRRHKGLGASWPLTPAVVHEPPDAPGGLTPCCGRTAPQIERAGGLWADDPEDVATCTYETED